MTTSAAALPPMRTGAGFGAVRAAAASKTGRRRPRDPAIPVIVALSLAAHVALLLPLLIDRDATAPVPKEIAVEIIQAPPPEPAARPASKAEAPKPKPPGPPAPQQQKPRPQPSPQEQKAAQQAAQQTAQQRQVAERIEKLFGAMPAIALPGQSDAGDEEVGYKQLVLSKVAKAKPEGRSRGIPGAASVSFTLGDGGEVVRCEIVHKSVDPKLDAEAVAMIRRGAPYPPPPAGAQRDFVITLRFAAMP